METNLAYKLPAAEEVIKEFKEAHNSLDLLRVFLITGTADINRSYDFIKKIIDRNTVNADKATLESALKILVNIELKRVALTASVYNVNDVQLPNMSTETTTDEVTIIETLPVEATSNEENKTIMMLPSLADLLERAKTILRIARARNNQDDATQATKQVFELLKTTVGQGKVLNTDGKPETWDNEQINMFLNTWMPDNTSTVEATKIEEIIPTEEVVKIGFEFIHGFMNDMIKANKKEPEVKEALKNILIGKIFASKESDYLIKDETIFEDFYTRMLGNIVQVTITAIETKNAEIVQAGSKEELAQLKIEEEIKPFLAKLDKDPTQSALTPVTRKLRNIYEDVGLKMSLRDAWFKARELATEIAPNLVARLTKSNAADKPVDATTTSEVMSGTTTVEIYDESHNIQESNKELWAEVEKYEYLNQLFTRAQELYKLGKWKDALSMSIILISSGKIRETATSKEVIKWDTDQIKKWYFDLVEASVVPFSDDVKETSKVETTNETETATDIQKETENSTEVTKPLAESVKEEQTVKQGPVPQQGSLDTKEVISRLLKDSSTFAATYTFKSFPVKTDHHLGGAMSFQIVDATDDQAKDLLITESNMTKLFDSQRDRLVIRQNDEKDVRKVIQDKLSAFYEINGSEVKRIVANLVKEATTIRRANKEAGKTAAPITDPTIVVTEPIADKVEDVIVPPTSPIVEEQSVESGPSQENQSTVISDIPTNEENGETTVGEDTISSNDDPTEYPGFEAIVNAKKKWDMDTAVYNKIMEYPDAQVGIKAVFDVIDGARKNHHFKKAFLRNYKSALPVDLLSTVNNIFTKGTEIAKKQ